MAELATTSLFSDAALQAYYKLEDTSDSKNSYTLTNTGSTPFNAAKFNNGADLGTSNTTKWLSREDGVGIAGNSDLSISLWVKLQTEIASGVYVFAFHENQTGADHYIQLAYDYNSGTRRLRLNSAQNTALYTVTLGTSNFHHIVITRNVSGNETKLYLDGSSVATGTVGTDFSGFSRITLGVDSNLSGGPASAIIDDVGFFSKVLSSTEVSTLFTDAAAGHFLTLMNAGT